MIRSIATLGRGNTKEFVTEYVMMYSDDGEQWRSYVNPDGEVQVTYTQITHNTKSASVQRFAFVSFEVMI